jgi:hypothetical protein
MNFEISSDNLSILFSALVAVATVVYAVLTWRLVEETRKMRESQTEPVVSVMIEQAEQWINLIDMVIRNIGLGPAYNLKFRVDPDFKYEDTNKNLSDLGFIRNGVQYLAPNQEIRFFLTSLVQNYKEKIEHPFQITVSYESFTGKHFERTYPIDFSMWDELLFNERNNLFKISQNLKELRDDIHYIASGQNKIKIISYTKQDEENEIQEVRERFREYKRKSEEKKQI